MGAPQSPPPPTPPPGGWNRHDWKDWGERLRDDIHRRSAGPDWRYRRTSSHLLMGVVIVGIGVLLLLDNLGIPGISDVWRFWPVILIVVGLSRIVENPSPSGAIWGLVVAGIGTIFLLDHLGFHISFHIFWPVILIGFGLSMLARNFGGGGYQSRRWMGGPGGYGGPGGVGGPGGIGGPSGIGGPAMGSSTSGPDFHLWTFFGGGRRRIDTKQFRGGDVLAIFGGYNIDLRDAVMADGKAVIDANSMFGGVDIWVPQNWTVEVVGHGVFGGFDDKTLPPRINPADKPQHLVVTGYAMFGGVTVKN